MSKVISDSELSRDFHSSQKFFAGRLHFLAPAAIFIAFIGISNFFLIYNMNLGSLPLNYPRGGPSPTWLQAHSVWDAEWYKIIATEGYPREVPTFKDTGRVTIGALAFFPLYPAITSFFMWIFGGSFEVTGLVLNLIFTTAALSLLYVWIYQESKRKWAAFLGVFSIFLLPSHYILHVTYTESLALLLLISVLYLISKGRFLAAIPVVILLSLTRNIAPAVGLVWLFYGVSVVVPYIKTHRSEYSPKEMVMLNRSVVLRYGALGTTIAASVFTWMVMAWAWTGSRTAYMDTYKAWRQGESGFLWWFTAGPFGKSDIYPFGEIGVYPMGTMVMVIPVLFFSLLALTWPSDYPKILKMMPMAFSLYLFIFTIPGGSEWRYMLLGLYLIPFTKVPEDKTKRILYFSALLLAFMVSLYWTNWWISNRWFITRSIEGGFVLSP